MYRKLPVRLHDCRDHRLNAKPELLIVEGESASKATIKARDPDWQAVLPMQGKPLNAWKASKTAVAQNELYHALIEAVGAGWGDDFDLQLLRYHQITLLFDPDADGIHCGALMLMFFYRWMRPLLEHQRIGIVHAPLCEFSSRDRSEFMHAYSEDQYRAIKASLDQSDVSYNIQRYRGLASMNETALVATCLDDSTRNRRGLDCSDAEMAIQVFTGNMPT